MEKELNPYNTIFALDIGTNSVVGLVGISEEQTFTITHSVTRFHKKRAMIDGQIHDIPSVLEIVKEVKEQLEEEIGFVLKQVSIAAAGRALRTVTVKQSIPLNQNKEIKRDQLKILEFEALKKAHEEINSPDDAKAKYFCVGHSFTKYKLDDMEISNPIGQKGNTLEGQIIATFLPEIVVDSLHTVMEKAGLEVDCMTLEPIAALDIIVPENIRLLNIALIDIGAGTSDIAITKEGTIVGYGMTDVAGDEITEEIAKALLVSFDQAEELKCSLSKSEEHRFTNILGESLTVTTQEVLQMIHGSINKVAEKIGKGIIDINGKSASAVFLVGGGSQIPGMGKVLSNYLKIPENRVVMKTTEDILNFKFNNTNLRGPEAITPLGIFQKSIKDHREDFIEISINKARLTLFQRNNLKVGDALALAKVDPRTLIPQFVHEVSVMVDEQAKKIASPLNHPVEIYLNGKLAGIDTPVKHKDHITIINNHSTYEKPFSLKSLLPKKWHVDYTYYVNDQKSSLDTQVTHRDKILLKKKKSIIPTKITTKNSNIDPQGIVEKNEEKAEKTKTVYEKVKIKVNEEWMELPKKRGPVIFTDIFDHIDFDRKEAKGKLTLKINGKRAGFMDELKMGDYIEIYWS